MEKHVSGPGGRVLAFPPVRSNPSLPDQYPAVARNSYIKERARVGVSSFKIRSTSIKVPRVPRSPGSLPLLVPNLEISSARVTRKTVIAVRAVNWRSLTRSPLPTSTSWQGPSKICREKRGKNWPSEREAEGGRAEEVRLRCQLATWGLFAGREGDLQLHRAWLGRRRHPRGGAQRRIGCAGKGPWFPPS